MATPFSSDSDDLRSPLVSSSASLSLEKLGIDEMLHKYCGEFGRWQLKHFVLVSLAWTLVAFHTMVMIFADRQPQWRCLPGPPGSGCDDSATTVCGFRPGSWEWVGGFGSSTVAEWGLVCGDKFKVGLVQSLFFTGCMIGGGIFGHLSDSFLGRKGSLTMVCLLMSILGILTAFSPNYNTYVLLRFLTGISTGGSLSAFVLATEPVGPTKRGPAAMSTFYFFSAGISLLSGIAYVFPTWRALYMASSIPSFLFLILVLIPFTSESPRWYLVRGRIKDAMHLMSTIAASNGNRLPPHVMLALDDETANNDNNEVVITGSLIDAIKSPLTRTHLFLAVAINFSCAVVYYGLSLNVVNLGTNLLANVALNAVAEMPAFTITAVLLNRVGRRWLTIGTLWFGGSFCLVGSVVGNNVGVWRVVTMVCGILGIFGAAGTYNLLYIYTAELFPTVVRNAALGCATQASQVGAILAPFVVVLGGGMPFAVFAMCGIMGGILAFYLPETLNKPLYDTFAGMANGEYGSTLLV
ncbi:organic cation/carnitine transporter 4 [Senna tora]|uniref:Organic cation/carnitine transporter 4 n=1 Tax=Senna tora TaxID=362788 RepID=A0A834WN04_9FABA|nr:organic cation/carnitine transporter 4 [Senna tora]